MMKSDSQNTQYAAYRACLQASFAAFQSVRIFAQGDGAICLQLRMKRPLGARAKPYANDHIASLCVSPAQAAEIANHLLALAALGGGAKPDNPRKAA